MSGERLTQEIMDAFIGGQLLIQNIRAQRALQGQIRAVRVNTYLHVEFDWIVSGHIIQQNTWQPCDYRQMRFDLARYILVKKKPDCVLIDLYLEDLVLQAFGPGHEQCYHPAGPEE